jgi:hypothetical protein
VFYSFNDLRLVLIIVEYILDISDYFFLLIFWYGVSINSIDQVPDTHLLACTDVT